MAHESPAVRLAQGSDGENPGNSTELGILYADGRGVVADLARAAALYLRCCDGGDATGCTDSVPCMRTVKALPSNPPMPERCFSGAVTEGWQRAAASSVLYTRRGKVSVGI